jgi:preprotein translocase subunit SecG
MDSSAVVSGTRTSAGGSILTKQTWVLAIVYALSTLGYVILAATNDPQKLLWLLVFLPFSALVVYDTECLVRGNCMEWAWIRTTLYALLPVIFLILLVIMLINSDSFTKKKK